MTTVYLVRHAHAHWIPDESRPLSDRGMRDAACVADIMQSLPIQYIYSSPYRRAAQTVELLAQRLKLPIMTYPDLRERLLADNAVDDFAKAVGLVWHDPTFAHPGGESNVVAQQRGIRAIDHFRQKHPHDHVVLASHGNLLALILQHFDPTIGYDFWQAMPMPDIYRLTLSADNKMAITRLWKA